MYFHRSCGEKWMDRYLKALCLEESHKAQCILQKKNIRTKNKEKLIQSKNSPVNYKLGVAFKVYLFALSLKR